MDWLRRNWPDLAIGVALVAVIAGIIATLLTGGSFFPVSPTQAPMQAETAPPSTQPGGVRPLAPGGLAESASPPAAAESEAPGAAAESPATEPGGATPETGPPVVAVPVAPPSAVTVTPLATAPAAPADQPAATAPATTPPAAAPAPAAVAIPGGMPVASSDAEAPYRVSVGAYGSQENADRQVAAFRAAGYPVFTGVQGSLTIVLVGPYDTEAAAEQVMARIRSGGFGVDPVMYRFRPDATSAAASTPAPASTPAATPVATPVATPAPAAAVTPAPPAVSPGVVATSAEGRYLQVGAYGSVESANPLRDRLAALGFAASERREDGLIKLLVGPFDQESLARARAQLNAQGIESFPR